MRLFFTQSKKLFPLIFLLLLGSSILSNANSIANVNLQLAKNSITNSNEKLAESFKAFVSNHTLKMFADQFWVDDFEHASNPSSGTRSPSLNTGSGSTPYSAYFKRATNAELNLSLVSDGDYSGFQGTYFWAGEDHDVLAGGNAEQEIEWTGINISGKTGIEFKGLFAAQSTYTAWESTAFGFTHSDYVLVEYSLDGGAYQKLIDFRGSSDGFGAKQLAEDTNNDGIGNGTVLTKSFGEFAKSIPGTGSTLSLRLRAYSNNTNNEEWAIDNFRLESATPSSAPPTVSTLLATDLSSSGARLNGNVTADGGAAITERGFVYSLTSSDASPSFAEVNGTTVFKEVVSGTTGSYNRLLSGLSSSSSYSYVAYATNSEGTTNGSVETFTTSAPPASLATVTTGSASGITASTATLNGDVSSDGGASVTSRGFVYSSSDATPTIGEGGVINISDGSATGSFAEEITGLSASTMYYFQAYATNSEGTSYGGVESFTTSGGGTSYTWTGSTDSDGGEAGNWDNGLPPAGSDIVIPEGATPYPVFDFDFEAGDITIGNNATFTMAPGFTLTFAAGKGATGDGKIILKSDGTGDASIGDLTGAGSIAVAVQQERFLAGGNRAFRFFSHPYTTAVPLSVVATAIDITGAGGSANGFTTTATNAPSAFRFDPLNADGNEDNDGGWEAFTSISQTIDPHEAIRILFRGSKGQANSLLDDGSYTPDPVTIEWEGTINQGTQNIALVGVASGLEFSDWNLVGNPFPSAIDLSAAGVTHTAGVVDYAVWRPRQTYTGDFSLIAGSGRGGAYLQEPFDTSPTNAKIPSGGGFFIRAGGTTGTLTIPEPAKTSVTPGEITNVLRMDNTASKYGANSLQLIVEADDDFVDRVLVFMDDSYTKAKDLADAPKLANPVVNFYTVSADDWALAIDRRGYQETEGENRIPLHLQAPNYSYTLSLPDFDLEEGRTLRLYDRFMEEYITLQKGTTYDFEVTDDPRTKGHRFDLVMGIEVITSIHPSNHRFQAYLLPNPAQEQVRISIQKPDNVATTNIRIVSMAGVEVRSEQINTATTELDINLSQLSKGIYLVEITHGTERIVKRLIVN